MRKEADGDPGTSARKLRSAVFLDAARLAESQLNSEGSDIPILAADIYCALNRCQFCSEFAFPK
jgi:hypothetical protein